MASAIVHEVSQMGIALCELEHAVNSKAPDVAERMEAAMTVYRRLLNLAVLSGRREINEN